MDISVIVITRNELPRLRLCLASLRRAAESLQGSRAEIVVVDDGSQDGTPAFLKGLAGDRSITVHRHSLSQGRSTARNAGAARASGALLFFLDGDTLIAPDCLEKHIAFHRTVSGIGRGEVLHLRQPRFLYDPEQGIPFPGFENRPVEPQALISVETIEHRFETVHQRATVGIYPGSVPRRLAEIEVAALRSPDRDHPLWMTASAQNLSVPRDAFNDVGGFCPDLDMNEHRDLALLLHTQCGLDVALIENAYSYHIAHSNSWRDPLKALSRWEPLFLSRHPRNDVKLLPFFWLSLGEPDVIPERLRIMDLGQLVRLSRGDISEYEQFRKESPLFAV